MDHCSGTDTNWWVWSHNQKTAGELLAKLAPDKVAEAHENALKSWEVDVRNMSQDYLKKQAPDRAAKALVKALISENPEIREWAAKKLAEQKDK